MSDNVREALRDIKAMSLGHHAHEDPAVLLHALLVEIPSACDEAIAALAAPVFDCGHESMTGLGHPRLWSCDGCGQITVEVDDTTGPCSDGTRRWRREVIGRVDVAAARKFGPPMPPAPVSPPAVAKRERRTVWFMENNAGLWMGSDMGSHTRDPNAAAQFTTREACEAACERDRASGPHPGVRVYRPTEHIFFGDDEVSVSPPAASRDAVAEVLLHEAHPDLAPWSLLQLSGHNSAGLVCAVALARRQADAILSRWSAPPAPHATDLAAMAKGIDEECCCVACGREVAPSPCCPDYPVWPGPCRSCYAVDAKSPAPRGEAVRHRPGHRPPAGSNAVVEIVSTSDLEADDVIFAEGRWLCVIDDGINDSTQVMAAEIIDDAAGQGLADTTYGEWFARVVALVPKEAT